MGGRETCAACIAKTARTRAAAAEGGFSWRGREPPDPIRNLTRRKAWATPGPERGCRHALTSVASRTQSLDTKAGANARVLVRFALPAIPAGCQVVDAQLRLYASSHKAGRTLQALRLGAGWTEQSVSWSNQPAPTGAAATAPSTGGYVQWSVGSQVQNMYGANHGFLVRDSTEGGNGIEQGFHSREKGTDNPPQLVIRFG